MMKPLSREDVIAAAQENLRRALHEENLVLLSQAVERFENDPEIRLLYATALIPSCPGQAPFEIARAIQLDPDHPWRLGRAARLLYFLDERKAACSYAERASRLSRDPLLDALLLNLAGRLAKDAGDMGSAAEALREAVEVDPADEDYAYDYARFLIEAGRPAEAAEVTERAIPRVGDPTKLQHLRDGLLPE